MTGLRQAAWMANRSGGKTRNFSILHHANSLFKAGCATVHSATIEAQAGICKRYIDEYLNLDDFADDKAGASSATLIRYHKDGRIEIKPGTINSYSGPKAQTVAIDEVEFMNWANVQQAIGMAHSKPDIPALVVFGSTRQKIFGSMNRLIDGADKMRITTYAWCIWEVVQRCPIKSNRCPLWNRCEGVRCQVGDGFLDIEDVIQKAALADDETWSTQYSCEKPSRKGLVFPTFDPVVHVGSQWEYDPARPVYLAVDWGWTNPAAVLFVQRTDTRMWVFDEVYITGKLHSELLELVEAKVARYGCRIMAGWGDPEEPNGQQTFRRGLGVQWMAGYVESVEERIRVVRTRLRDARGISTVFFHPRCANTIREFSLYHHKEIGMTPDGEPLYSEEPVDEDNHAMACLGFLCWAFRGSGTFVTSKEVLTVNPVAVAHNFPDSGVEQARGASGVTVKDF